MNYTYENGDQDVLIARLGPHFTPYAEPMDVQIALRNDPLWDYLAYDLQLTSHRLLRLELDEDGRQSAQVTLGEFQAFGDPSAQLEPPTAEEQKLWRAVATHPNVPASMEVVVRDLLLSTGVDRTPANAERIVDGYRKIAQGPGDGLQTVLAILRANTIARSRSMPVEAAVRADTLVLAERTLTATVLPGISLRHAGAIAEPPRTGTRAANELVRLASVLDHIEATHRDASTIDWVMKCRLAAVETEPERDAARRRHVELYMAIADGDTVPFRAMLWMEKAVALAAEYGTQDLRDTAVVKMQKLSRTDLGWEKRVEEIKIPIAFFRQRERTIARFSSWEQAVAKFLAEESPSGSNQQNKREAASFRNGILDLVSGRTFGSHQLPERTHGPAEQEKLSKLVQRKLIGASMVLRVDLAAIASRFGVPGEDEIIAFLSTIYASDPKLVRPFAQALRLHWSGDPSSAARLAIPLIEAGARELLILMDEPLYRSERGASPGRFPAMDFYLELLEKADLDPDWATALRGTLLSGGMNLRNRLAHGFKLDFSEEESALVLRLAGLFIGMSIGTGAIEDERVRAPLAVPRKRLRRRLGWLWR